MTETGAQEAGDGRLVAMSWPAEPFGFVELPGSRQAGKPRVRGFTMMIDWGLGLGKVADVLAAGARYLDLAKVAVGTARFYPESILRSKLELYREHAVRPFIGGQFVEYVIADTGIASLDRFFDEAVQLGFDVIEVSDNVVPLTERDRRDAIAMARDRGLAVLGEVGAKWEADDAGRMIGDAEVCLDAGCELVLVEGAQLVDDGGGPRRDMLDALVAGLDVDRILFELPGTWITGCTQCSVYDMKKLLVAVLGPDVNLANVLPDELIETEALRCGLSVTAGSAR